jgi:hypothetical protein
MLGSVRSVSLRRVSRHAGMDVTSSKTRDFVDSVSPGHLAWSRGLSASQSAHHFMYISLDHGHLGTEDYTLQYTLPHTSSPAPTCLQIHM